MKVRALTKIFVAELAICTLFAGSDKASAEDWTHWRGPTQDGISKAVGLVDDWSLPKQNVLWHVPIGGRGTPIVMHGKVYMNCGVVEQTKDSSRKQIRERVVCLDASTGKILWEDRFNVFQTDISSERIGWASMAGDPETGNVYLHSVSGLFRCYSGDGEQIWETSLAEDYGKISGFGGRTQTPIIDEGRVIVSFLAINWGATGSPPPKHYYYAFDKKHGDLIWVSAPGGKPYDTNFSVPIVRVLDGRRVLIGGNSDGGCYAMDARTGKPIWGFRMSKRGINVSPVTDGNLVYIAHGEDNIDNTSFGRVQCIRAAGQGDVTDSHGVWRRDGIKVGIASLLCQDGILYAVADTGMLHAFDSKTGDDLWEYNLGSMGWGSPVWADGKIIVTEVHGNVHVLKTSREKCEAISSVHLSSLDGTTHDDIFSSPAISRGKIFFVTRERTICLGKNEETSDAPIPTTRNHSSAATNSEHVASVDYVQLVPYETIVTPGQSIDYRLHRFDRNGNDQGTVSVAELKISNLNAVKLDGNRVSYMMPNSKSNAVARDRFESAGKIIAKSGGLSAEARIRTFPRLPWSWDFEGYTGSQVPETWIRAFGKLKPQTIDRSTAMLIRPGKGRPSSYIWIGPSKMENYTIQADVMTRQKRRRMSDIGITSQRYNLILRGNSQRLEVQSWPGELRMADGRPFTWDPDVWYRMKMQVKTSVVSSSFNPKTRAQKTAKPKGQGRGLVRGKVWKRTDPEPLEWTIEVADPFPNFNGSPGLFAYSLTDSYFDNIHITRTEQ